MKSNEERGDNMSEMLMLMLDTRTVKTESIEILISYGILKLLMLFLASRDIIIIIGKMLSSAGFA